MTAPTYPYPDNPGRTHWAECWRERGHHNCAVALVDRIAERCRSKYSVCGDEYDTGVSNMAEDILEIIRGEE